MPDAIAKKIEHVGRIAQGKGAGSFTVAAESAAAISLLPPASRSRLTAVDIGANIGDWTAALLARNPAAAVTCFEPSEIAFARLSDRFAHTPNVQLLPLAIGRDPGTAQLWADQPGSGLASLTRRRLDHFGLDFSHSETVQMVCLDDWCSEAGCTPDLIKLDIEGHEMDALAGGQDAVSRALVVQFEFGGCNIDTRTYFQDFFYYFRHAGFDLFRLSPRGLVPVAHYRESDEAFVTTNFFARKSDLAN